MALREPGQRASYDSDSGVDIDQQGYCLAPGDDAGETVKLATLEDSFIGVSFRSNFDPEDEEVYTGDPVAVEWDGWVNVLCVDGTTYNFGDDVYLSDVPGVADKNVDTDAGGTDDTKVGTVVRNVDLSDGDGTGEGLVPVNISGQT